MGNLFSAKLIQMPLGTSKHVTIGMLIVKRINILTFAILSAGHRSEFFRKGKSGQQRATHRLSAGFFA